MDEYAKEFGVTAKEVKYEVRRIQAEQKKYDDSGKLIKKEYGKNM